MNINSNTLLDVTKNIKVYNNCIIAQEGPNIVAKMSLGDVLIEYDSVTTGRQTIASQGAYQAINYGFLGTDVTFLAIKATYGSPTVNQGGVPYYCTDADNYIEYYFSDQPLIKRAFTNMLVLTGNDLHRIPQIYVINNTDYTVILDIMMSNLDPNTVTLTEPDEITGLAFSDITTDQMYGAGVTGCTQFEVLDLNGNIQMVIPITSIDVIKIEDMSLLVTTNSVVPIRLTFLSTFNMYQALSRMQWVMDNRTNRYLTTIYPGLDTTAPVITMNAYSVPTIMPLGSGILKSDLTFRFINNITDYDNSSILRDGVIYETDQDIVILKTTTNQQLSAITADGYYSVTFTAKDIATNSSSKNVTVLVDSVPPEFHYTTGYTINVMDLTGNTQTPGTIEKTDINLYYIDYIWDTIDGIIPNSATTITITSGSTFTSITGIGYYTINFSVSDTAANVATGTTVLRVKENSYPVFTFNSGSTGFTMSLGTGLTMLDVVLYTVSSVTDTYDGNIALTNVSLTGTTFPIGSTGSYTIVYSVSDASGNITTATKNLTVI